MTTYTVYFNTTDYPGLYVIRKFLIEPGKVTPLQIIAVSSDYAKAINEIPPGFHAIQRDKSDDPVIIETWI